MDSEDYRGQEIKSNEDTGLSIRWAVLDEILVVSVGQQGFQTLRQIVDASLAGGSGEELEWADSAVADRLNLAPEAWQGASSSSGLQILDLLIESASAGDEAVIDSLQKLRQAIRQFDLELTIQTLSLEGALLRARGIF